MSKASKGLFGNGDGTDNLGGDQPYLLNLDQPADSLASPDLSQLGGSDSSGLVSDPGVVIGISAPTVDDAAPADSAPAGDDTSSGQPGDTVLGEALDVIRVEVADDNDEDTNQKGGGASFDPRAANTPGSPRPAPDARHQSGRKPLLHRHPQYRRDADRLQVGHPQPHLQLPDLGLEL
jgi:hypothetical protein